MSDTRILLERVAEFRRRIESMPRMATTAEPPLTVGSVIPIDSPKGSGSGGVRTGRPAAADTVTAMEDRIESGSRTQAVLAYAVRRLNEAPVRADTPVVLTDRTRRLAIEIQAMVSRLRSFADDPLLSSDPRPDGREDVCVAHYRETAAMVETVARQVIDVPESATEQMRIAEGLEGLVDAVRLRTAQLAETLEQRRIDVGYLETTARFLAAVAGTDVIDAEPLVYLAHSMLATEPGTPLRLLSELPGSVRGYLGGPEYAAPARYVAAHAVNCAKITARLVAADPEWRSQPLPPMLAALLHDAGMLKIDPATLAQEGSLDHSARRTLEAHPRIGADMVIRRLPKWDVLADAIECHHERLDGTGYPAGIAGERLSPLARLTAVVDAYAGMAARRPHRTAHDPRSALADLLWAAEQGKFDRYVTDRLLALGFHPAGTFVELSDGRIGMVVMSRDPRATPSLSSRPAVAVLMDADGRTTASPRFVDLAESPAVSVVRALPDDDRMRRLTRRYPEWTT